MRPNSEWPIANPPVGYEWGPGYGSWMQSYAASDHVRAARVELVPGFGLSFPPSCGGRMRPPGILITELEADLIAWQPRPHTRAAHRRHNRGLQPAVRQRIHKHGTIAPEGWFRKKLEKWTLPFSPGCEPRGPWWLLPAFGGWYRPGWWLR